MAVVAKLTGGGFCVVRNVLAMGWLARYLSSGVGLGASFPLAPMATSSCANSAAVFTGKPSKLCITISTSLSPGTVNFKASPRGVASPILSGMVGMPVKFEKRPSTAAVESAKSFALVMERAAGSGVNVPSNNMPFA